MTNKPRAPTASKVWKKLLCDPKGDLTQDGRTVLSDLAKYCRYADAPTRHDATGRVDALATMEAVGMQKLLRRMYAMLAINEARASELALAHWRQNDDEELT